MRETIRSDRARGPSLEEEEAKPSIVSSRTPTATRRATLTRHPLTSLPRLSPSLASPSRFPRGRRLITMDAVDVDLDRPDFWARHLRLVRGQSSHFKTLSRPSEEAHRLALRKWDAFCDELEGAAPRAVDGADPPGAGACAGPMGFNFLLFFFLPTTIMTDVLKTFACYLGMKKARGTIDPRGGSTLATVKNQFKIFTNAWQRKSRTAIPRGDAQKALAYLKSPEFARLRTLTTAMRPKPVAMANDLSLVSKQAWRDSSSFIRHNRERIQFVCVASLGFLTSARPGELVESTAYRSTGQCLLWKHVSFIVHPPLASHAQPGARHAVTCKVRNDWMKGHRTDDAVFRESVLTANLEEPAVCAVVLLLALALLDGAFEDVSDVEDIFIHGRRPVIKHELSETPVFRSVKCLDGTWTVTGDGIGYHRYWYMLRHYGRLAGFRGKPVAFWAEKQQTGAPKTDALTHYAWRRGLGNVLDTNTSISSSSRRSAMGHTEQSDEYVSFFLGGFFRLAHVEANRRSGGSRGRISQRR